MQQATRGAQGEPAPQAMRDELAAMIQDHGETSTVRRLGIGRQTLARVIGGMRVRRGTIALIRHVLSSSTPTTPRGENPGDAGEE